MRLEEQDNKIVKLGAILNYLERIVPKGKFDEFVLGQGPKIADLGYRVDPEKFKIVVITTKGESYSGVAIVLDGRDAQIVYSITSIPPYMQGERLKAIIMAFDKTRNLKMYIKIGNEKNPFNYKKIDVDEICEIDMQKLKKGWFS